MDKEFILAEIKRTAELNGGKPLGAPRLAKETGIRRYDWQEYWPKLSDAHRELGLQTNSLCTKYESKFLCEIYARYAIELGELPLEFHLRKRKRENRDFPSRQAFAPKREFITKLMEFCRERPQFSILLPWCEEFLRRGRPKQNHVADPSDFENDGIVYLAKTRRGYKIGRTDDWEQRLRQIQLHNADDVQLVHLIKTDDPSGVEAYWHRRFKSRRVVAKSKTGQRRNWYNLTADDVRAFKRWKQI